MKSFISIALRSRCIVCPTNAQCTLAVTLHSAHWLWHCTVHTGCDTAQCTLALTLHSAHWLWHCTLQCTLAVTLHCAHWLWHCTMNTDCDTAQCTHWLWHCTVHTGCDTALWTLAVTLHSANKLWHCTVHTGCDSAQCTLAVTLHSAHWLWHCTEHTGCDTAQCTLAVTLHSEHRRPSALRVLEMIIIRWNSFAHRERRVDVISVSLLNEATCELRNIDYNFRMHSAKQKWEMKRNGWITNKGRPSGSVEFIVWGTITLTM